MSQNRIFTDRNDNTDGLDISERTSNAIESESTNSNSQDALRFDFQVKKDRLGGYWSCLCGRIVIGPQFIRLFWSLCFFALLSACLWFKSNLILEDLNWIVLGLAIFLVGISCLAFVQLSTTDPGVLPKDYNLANWAQEYLLHKDLPDSRMNYCNMCKAIRPPRSFHCIFCNICIRQQDLHFFMSGACVGQLNVRKYITLVNLLNVMSFFMIIVDITLIFFHFEQKSFTRRDYLAVWISFFLCLSLQILPQTGILMFCYRLYLVKANRTMREEFSSMMNRKKLNIPQSRSFFRNFCVIIGPPKHPSFFKQKLNQVHDEYIMSRGIGQTYRIVSEDHEESLSDNQSQSISLSQNSDKLGERKILTKKELRADPNKNKMEVASLKKIKEWRRYESKTEKIKPYNSSAILDGGALHKVQASGRFRLSKKGQGGLRNLAVQEIQRFQEISKIPLCDQPRPRPYVDSLSDSCIPRSSNDRLIVQMSRAAKFEKIIKLLVERNMDGLRRYGQRVNIGALLGIQNLDLDNLQLVDLGGLPLFGLPAGFIVDENQSEQNLIGISQLSAAGLIPPLPMIREIVQREAEEAMRQRLLFGNNLDMLISVDVNRNRIRITNRTRTRTNRRMVRFS